MSRFLLVSLSLALVLSGLIALLLGLTVHFLPHDEQFLGMSAADLCALHECRIVHFMVHDRVSFGGTLVAIGLIYLWLAARPLRAGDPWAWWALCLSGLVGFASFFAYLGYGYLDTWHGLATLGILPCFVFGLAGTKTSESIRCLGRASAPLTFRTAAGLGRLCLLGTSVGLMLGGLTILVVGMTSVFVPQDLAFMGLRVADLHAVNARLVPLIAHDRAGFGGAVCCYGVAMFFVVWCAELTRSLWYVLAVAGASGFGWGVGIHPAVGYNDAFHLAPALLGSLAYTIGLMLTFRSAGGSPAR